MSGPGSSECLSQAETFPPGVSEGEKIEGRWGGIGPEPSHEDTATVVHCCTRTLVESWRFALAHDD